MKVKAEVIALLLVNTAGVKIAPDSRWVCRRCLSVY